MTLIDVRLAEWSTVGPDDIPQLRQLNLDGEMGRSAAAFGHRLKIKETRAGLEISSNSHVGRVTLGPLQVHIKPKIPALELLELLRYACGLRDVRILPATGTPLRELGLHELLVSLLAAEARELLRVGLPRVYMRKHLKLDSPRGQIDIDGVIRLGGIVTTVLPCIVTERDSDWHLTRVLAAGLRLGASITDDLLLRRELHYLEASCEAVSRTRLDLDAVDTAIRGLTRQSAHFTQALELIRLLVEARGIDPDAGDNAATAPGYLFDMNMFFQRFLSRFFHEFLIPARIVDEHVIRGVFSYMSGANPLRRNIRSPRPDFALYRNKSLLVFMDAKYRDLWSRTLPREWLYQVSLYAVHAPRRQAIVLYATSAQEACDQRIAVRAPVDSLPSGEATVTLRPVIIPKLVSLLGKRDPVSLRAFAMQLVQPFG